MGKTDEKKLSNSGYIQLPFNEDEFKDFIGKLLGKPESITGQFSGGFEIQKEGIYDLNELLDQRVKQQNKGKLVSCNIKMYFSNGSAKELSDLESFLAFREIGKKICIRLDITWIYLIFFEGKTAPEKQEITVSFISRRTSLSKLKLNSILSDLSFDNRIKYEIRHTAKTWGNDVEALLRNYLENFINHPNKITKIMQLHSGKIGIFIFFSIVFSYFITFIKTMKLFSLKLLTEFQNRASDLNVSEKLDELICFLVTGKWEKFLLYSFGGGVLVVLLSILLGIWVADALDIEETSYLLFTDESKKYKERMEKKKQKQWLIFIFSLLTSILAGVISNYIFNILIKVK